jgi:HD-GYP domain-containing protein (c-di-GMP phosphodiesterase class II)
LGEPADGSGYPDRLRGLDIPFGARVVAVADSYDAMTTKRPYRQAMPVEKAALILRQGRAQQWDPAVVDACLRVIAGRLAPVEHPHVAEATPRGESIEQPA